MRYFQALGKVKGRGRIYSVGKVWLGRILEEIAVFVKFPESGGASQILGWEQSGGKPMPAVDQIVCGLSGRASDLKGLGGTWVGEALSIGDLSPISTPGRRGML